MPYIGKICRKYCYYNYQIATVVYPAMVHQRKTWWKFTK